ncbi:MAG: hypothetical protein IJ833_01430 [Lachnospiraceae bacterium]|nr:hypothetical protein [Lachnospiraceae bacterium]
MDFIEKIGDVVSEAGKEAFDKAKELKEIAHLKSQIAACQEVVDKNYLEIGKLYYEKYKENAEAGENLALAKQCRAIENAQRGVDELKEKLQQIKHR